MSVPLNTSEFVDQNPIGKNSRSNPVTYVKAFDEIRSLLFDATHAKARGLKPSHFSFNVTGERCETCEGEGHVTVGMQFMADLQLVCESVTGSGSKTTCWKSPTRARTSPTCWP